MRLLHAGTDHVGGGLHRRGPHPRPGGDPGVDERESLPLLGVPADCRGCPRGVGQGGGLMQPFSYARPATLSEALVAASKPSTQVLAGGTELLNWMRLGI